MIRCGHTTLNEFNIDDPTTWKRAIACQTVVLYGGVDSDS